MTLHILVYALQKPSFRCPVNDRVVIAFLDGPSMYSQCATNRFSGTNYGLNVDVQKNQEQLLTACDARGQLIVILL